ncbi:MAG: PAS domain S-box protein [Anaerolineae bacterium]|nr:PAS domain S-box protein [Anaerolineae bacterium]
MTWLFPSVVATLAGAIVLALAYVYLYYRDRELCMGIWTVGWAIYALRFACMLLIILFGERPVLLIGNQLFSLISGILLLLGSYVWIGRRTPSVWIWVSVACGVWIVLATLFRFSFWVLALPTFTVIGLLYIWTGVVFIREKPVRGFGQTITAWTFILWGLHKIDYPFLRPVLWFAPWGYLLGAVFELVTALGMILIYFERARDTLQKSEQQFRILFNSAQDNVLFHLVGNDGLPGHYIEVNDSTCETLGYSREELLAMGPQDITIVDDPAEIAEITHEIVQNGQARFEAVGRTKYGREIPFEINAHLVELDGQPVVMAVSRNISERKQNEERIEHLNAVLRAIRNVNQLITREKDRDRLLEQVCHELTQTRGYLAAWIILLDQDKNVLISAESGLGDLFTPFVDRLKQGQVSACIREAMGQPGVIVFGKSRANCGDCLLLDLESQGRLLIVRLEHGGQIYGVLSASVPKWFGIDVEERDLFTEVAGDIAFALHSLEAEAALKDTLQTSDDIVQTIPSGLFIYQFKAPDELWLLDGNPEAERLTGIKIGEWQGREFNDIWPEARLAGVTDAYLQVMRTGETFETEDLYYEDKRLSGAFRIRAFRVPQKRLVVAFENVTERRRMEEALRESEEKYRILFEHLPIPVFTKNREGEYTSCNAENRKYWAASPIGRTDAELLDHKTAAALREADLSVMETGDMLTVDEYLINTPLGERQVLSRKVPLRNGSGSVVGILGASIDITDRKQAEAQILADLAEKETLLREIHHRVKNNLQVISSLLDFQAQYTEDEGAIAVLRESRQRVQAMALVHEQLYQPSDLSHIDMAIYVRILTTDLLAMYQNSQHPVQLQVDVQDIFFEVQTAIPCGLIINELVSNAFKHAFPANASELPCPHRVRIAIDKRPENCYHLSISDNGIGLPSDFRFPPGGEIQRRGQIHRQGSLGLFLVDTFVRQLKGSIEWHGEGGTRCEIVF